ncbi:uncharacterized protein LOC108631535, partial [Ceratina calcarata]|uniref:Uncharacterized protein LOC108631535 n=1 Tax=Ceratina calcarata TaxID=156304 RepID=A0AAJ7NEB9_9HYME
MKPEDEECERIFRETHRRDLQGRYEVRLPLKPNLPLVGDETRRMALGSLRHMHRRFARDPKLAQGYREFMRTYEELGHMTPIPSSEIPQSKVWYVPHHSVIQGTPDTWKLRIRVHRDDQDYQRIVWAPDADSSPVEYRLSTVTYGTACAPFLAIRTLLQLAEDEGTTFPLGAQCLNSETYVDDTFAGADDLITAIQKRDELVKILSSAGISLDKWAANYVELLPPKAEQSVIKNIE